MFDSSADFRAAFDDFVAEGGATAGELSLLTDAIGTGTFARVLDQLDLGAAPPAAIDAQAQSLAAARGTTETAGAGWALAALAFAAGRVGEAEVARHRATPAAVVAAQPPTVVPAQPPTTPLQAPPPPHPPYPSPQPAGSRSHGRLIALLAAVVVVGLIAVTTVAVVLLNRMPDDNPSSSEVSDAERREALATARSSTVEILSTDHARYDADLEEATALMTTNYAASYRRTSEDIRTGYQEQEITVSASDAGGGLVGISRDRAVALVFINQSVTKKSGKPSSLPYRVAVSLERVDGSWLVDELGTEDAPTDPTEPDADRQEVLDAATETAEVFTNFDYRDPDATFDGVLQRSTGDFADQYRKGTADLEKVAKEAHSVMTAEVFAAGLETFSTDRATVVVATSGEVTNDTTDGTPEPRSYRMKLELQRVDGEWLTSDLQYVELG